MVISIFVIMNKNIFIAIICCCHRPIFEPFIFIIGKLISGFGNPTPNAVKSLREALRGIFEIY